MPLLNKKPFSFISPPEDLRVDEKGMADNKRRRQLSPPARRPAAAGCGATSVTAPSLSEVERQYSEGSMKSHMVAVLKAARPRALSAEEIYNEGIALGIADNWTAEDKARISRCLINDVNFVRMERGKYSLRVFHPQIQVVVKGTKHAVSRPQPMTKRLKDEVALGQAESAARAAHELAVRRRAALDKATDAVNAARQRLQQARLEHKGKGKEKKEVFCVSPEELAQFEMSAEETEFRGDPEDRKGMLEHRQRVQLRRRGLDQARAEYLKALRLEYEARVSNSSIKALESQVRKADKELLAAAEAAAKAETAEKAATHRLSLLQKHQGLDASSDGWHAKRSCRYPIDDMQLLDELAATSCIADVAPPTSWLSSRESAILANSLYVSDVLHHFGRHIGIKSLSYFGLRRMIDAAVAVSATYPDTDHPSQHDLDPSLASSNSELATLYFNIVQVILTDLESRGEATSKELRWLAVLSFGNWPDVLRRMAHARSADSSAASMEPDAHVLFAASILGFSGPDGLTDAAQHITLLRWLVDVLMDTTLMRTILDMPRNVDILRFTDILSCPGIIVGTEREHAMLEALKDARGDMAGERKRLKHLTEIAKRDFGRTENVRGGQRSREVSATIQKSDADTRAHTSRPASSVANAANETMPSFELPKHLHTFRGDPRDDDARQKFNKEQRAAKRKLEKERALWSSKQRRRQREEDAEQHAAEQAKRELERERMAAKDALERAAEAMEEQLGRHALRRAPLGYDRRYRRYWWGLGGHRAALFVEDGDGGNGNVWGQYDTVEAVEALLESMDRRGVRERALAEALEKKLQAITAGMRKGMGQVQTNGFHNGGAHPRPQQHRNPIPQPARHSTRERRKAKLFDPSESKGSGQGSVAPRSLAPAGNGSKRPHSLTFQVTDTSVLSSIFSLMELPAVVETLEQLITMQTAAAASDIPPARGGMSWDEWVASLRAIVRGVVRDEATQQTRCVQGPGDAALLRRVLKELALDLERAIVESIEGVEGDGNESNVHTDGDGLQSTKVSESDGDGASSGEEEDSKGGAAMQPSEDGGGDNADYVYDVDDDENATNEDDDGDRGNDSGGNVLGRISSRHESIAGSETLGAKRVRRQADVSSMYVITAAPSKARRTRKVWRSGRDRTMWRQDVRQAKTAPRLAYSVAVLELQVRSLLQLRPGMKRPPLPHYSLLQ